jgi:hypothetical protein
MNTKCRKTLDRETLNRGSTVYVQVSHMPLTLKLYYVMEIFQVKNCANYKLLQRSKYKITYKCTVTLCILWYFGIYEKDC